MSEVQNTFRKVHSCIDCIFTIIQIIEKRAEHNLPTYIGLTEYEKAFDRVDRNKLWDVMVDHGFPLSSASVKSHTEPIFVTHLPRDLQITVL
jgi:hypothetical protein